MCLELGLFVLLTLNTIRPSCIQPTLNGTPNWNSKCSLVWFSPTEIEPHTISKSLSFSHNQFSSTVEYLQKINECTSQICFKITNLMMIISKSLPWYQAWRYNAWNNCFLLEVWHVLQFCEYEMQIVLFFTSTILMKVNIHLVRLT